MKELDMKRKKISKIFKSNFIEFMGDILPKYLSFHLQLGQPMMKSYLYNMKDTDMILLFSKYVLPYKKYIHSKDELILLKIMNILPKKYESYGNGIISDIRKMSSSNKDQVWKWISTFLILSEKYSAYKL